MNRLGKCQMKDPNEKLEILVVDDEADSREALAELLLNEGGVAVVPGGGFGAPGHIRISFATSMSNLEKAIERMGRVLAGHAVAKTA